MNFKRRLIFEPAIFLKIHTNDFYIKRNMEVRKWQYSKEQELQ